MPRQRTSPKATPPTGPRSSCATLLRASATGSTSSFVGPVRRMRPLRRPHFRSLPCLLHLRKGAVRAIRCVLFCEDFDAKYRNISVNENSVQFATKSAFLRRSTGLVNTAHPALRDGHTQRNFLQFCGPSSDADRVEDTKRRRPGNATSTELPAFFDNEFKKANRADRLRLKMPANEGNLGILDAARLFTGDNHPRCWILHCG